jgi:hypothetical protein
MSGTVNLLNTSVTSIREKGTIGGSGNRKSDGNGFINTPVLTITCSQTSSIYSREALKFFTLCRRVTTFMISGTIVISATRSSAVTIDSGFNESSGTKARMNNIRNNIRTFPPNVTTRTIDSPTFPPLYGTISTKSRD